MNYWLFVARTNYQLDDRLADPDPNFSFRVDQFRDRIALGDFVFLWQAGGNGVRGVVRVIELPRPMADSEADMRHWQEGQELEDGGERVRATGTITHRRVDLPRATLLVLQP